MALGVNIQLGYAGIFNAGVMGFAALGGLSAVLIAYPPGSRDNKTRWERSTFSFHNINSRFVVNHIYLQI